MQTKCPQCETQFRVTEEQINIADGMVRCGVCKNIFNVFEVSDETLSEHNDLPSLTNNDYSEELPPEETADSETAHVDISDLQTIDEAIGFDENKTTAPDKVQEDTLDFFNEEIAESLPHVVPEKFRKPHKSKLHHVSSIVLWSTGILLLSASLVLEYIWFNRDQYSNSPELQAVIEQLCQQFECKQISMRDPSKIELIARNIYTHPNAKDALMVDVTMKNNAKFSQPYPVMSISFSDIRGNAVAFRNFRPGEYLPKDNKPDKNKQLDLLQPDASSSLTLEIQDPGKQATTYEFNFL